MGLEEQFVGVWRLVSNEYRREDGTVSYPLGPDMAGLLIYTANGYMAGQLMNPNRPNFAGNDRFRGSPEEIKAAFEGYTAYCGTYEINETEGIINHIVEQSLYPNWLGSVQKRFYEFTGPNRLTLKTPPMFYAGQNRSGTLVWERVV